MIDPTGPQPDMTAQPGVQPDIFGNPGLNKPDNERPQVRPMEEAPFNTEHDFKQTAFYVGLGAAAVLIPIFLLICTCLIALSSADQQDPSKAQAYQEFDHED